MIPGPDALGFFRVVDSNPILSAMPYHHLRASLVAVTVTVLVSGCHGSESMELPLIRIAAQDYTLTIPARIPRGLVRLRLVNSGPDIHEALVVRFSGAGTAAGYVDSVRADVDFPAFGADMGGAGLAGPGDSSEIILQLEPGRYAVVCWKGDHLRRGMARDFEVIDSSGPTPRSPPEHDLEITMTEYGYGVSRPIGSGPLMIQIRNTGNQPHELDLYRKMPGKTVADYESWTSAGEIGDPPAEPMGGTGDFIAGRTVWLPINLPPGLYFMICHVPDLADGKPHYRRGMVREFEVR